MCHGAFLSLALEVIDRRHCFTSPAAVSARGNGSTSRPRQQPDAAHRSGRLWDEAGMNAVRTTLRLRSLRARNGDALEVAWQFVSFAWL
jgi:hypothetical protein